MVFQGNEHEYTIRKMEAIVIMQSKIGRRNLAYADI